MHRSNFPFMRGWGSDFWSSQICILGCGGVGVQSFGQVNSLHIRWVGVRIFGQAKFAYWGWGWGSEFWAR